MTMPGSTRDIVVDVTIRSDTKGAKEGAAALGDVDKAAGGAGKSMKGLEVDSKSLDAQIAKSKQTVKDLEAELTKVGNNPGLRKSLRVERSWLSELEKISKNLPDVKLPSPSFDLGPLKSALMPALIGMGVVVSPFIGAAVAGAVVGGVGLGGIAGGVFAASHDDRVKAAWKDFTGSLTKESFGSNAFVQPVIDGINILKNGLADLHIGDILGKGADAVPRLAAGLIAFAKGVMPGVSAALDHSREIAAIFSQGLGEVGTSIGKLIKDFAESKGAMMGLRTTFTATADVITFVGDAVTFLSNRYYDLVIAGGAVADVMAHIYFWMPLAGDAFKDGAQHSRDLQAGLGGANDVFGNYTNHILDSINAMGSMGYATDLMNRGLDPFVAYLAHAAANVDTLHKSLDEIFAPQLAMDQATLAWKQDVLDLTKAVYDHGHSLKDNTQDGLENQRMLQGMVGDAMSIREATLKQTGSVDEANAAYKRQIDALYKLAEGLGFSKAALDKIVGKYEITVLTHYVDVDSRQAKNLALSNKLEGRADGGPVMAGVPYKINERGYETVTFPSSATVHPANLTPMAGGSMSARPLIIQGDALADVFMTWLRNTVGQQGGTLAVLGIRT